MAERCGSKTYADALATVYGDSRFIAVFPRNKPDKFTFELF